MNQNKNISILFFFTLISILTKWIVLQVYFDNNIITNVITSIEDEQYFPLIISLSNFDFSPGYLEHINNLKIISFPFYGLIFHAFFYSFLGIYSFIVLEFVFQFIFFLVLYKTLEAIFNSSKKSLFFCIVVFFLVVILKFLSIQFEINYFQTIYDAFNENIGTRTPRPLLTGIFYFLFYFLIFRLEKIDHHAIDFKYFLSIAFLLSIFLNSFFYYFVNFTVLFILLFYFCSRGQLINIITNNKKKIFFIFFYFFIFASPFLIQLIFGETDYSKRIGVIELDLEKKLFLLKYYIVNLFRKEFLALLIPCFIIHFYLNYKKTRDEKTKKINIFFFFINVSIVTPPLFFLLSPTVVSIYHFLGMLIFSILFYLFLTIFHFAYDKIMNKKKFLNFKNLIFVFFVLYSISNFFVDKKNILKDYEQSKDLNQINNFLKKNNLSNTKYRLFTNDLNVMNLWLLNNNSELSISDGFTNALTNNQIELNLINNLKHFELGEENFKKIISYGESQYRNKFFMTLFVYRYQANSLFTYSSIENYTDNFPNLIKKTSPFRAQSQIVPEDEKKRLLNLFKKHKINDKFLSDYVIINYSENYNLNDLKIMSDNYLEIYSNSSYQFFERINKT